MRISDWSSDVCSSDLPYALYPGQQLRIPAGLYHRVAAGETGIGIAQAYGVDWGEVITIKAISPPYILRVGQRLRLPPAADPQSPAEVAGAARHAALPTPIHELVHGSQPTLAAHDQTGRRAGRARSVP